VPVSVAVRKSGKSAAAKRASQTVAKPTVAGGVHSGRARSAQGKAHLQASNVDSPLHGKDQPFKHIVVGSNFTFYRCLMEVFLDC
jgi:hypothetical protein